jgi:hypothetical protein
MPQAEIKKKKEWICTHTTSLSWISPIPSSIQSPLLTFTTFFTVRRRHHHHHQSLQQ